VCPGLSGYCIYSLTDSSLKANKAGNNIIPIFQMKILRFREKLNIIKGRKGIESYLLIFGAEDEIQDLTHVMHVLYH
jgi:hypothetical protein